MTSAIDLFAGLGGFSEGATAAGIKVLYAANHWPLACEYHKRNHPSTEVVCQDVQQADWREVPPHDLLLASPACQGHSKARGTEKAHHDALRSTAWAVVAAAEYHRPRAVVVENVTEFQDWNLFPSWCDAMSRLGYSLAPHIIDAADHGVPQHRVRLFMVCTRSKALLHLRLPKRDHVAVDSVIDWDSYSWTPIDKPGRSAATLARVASGRARFGRRFVAPFYGSGSGETGRSVHRPIGTLTTIDRWLVVDGDRCRVLQPAENLKIMGMKPTTELPRVKRQANHLIGNAVAPPVATDLLNALQEHI